MSARILCGIYRIRNTVNGRVYVGAAGDVATRWVLHRLHLKRGDHHCRPLQGAWIKYGGTAFVFEFIEAVERNKKALESREQVYLDEAFAAGLAYNIAPKAYSCLGIKRSADTRAKQSASLKGKNLGRKATPEARANMSAAQQMRPPATAEALAKRSESLKAFYADPIASAEARATISAYHKGNKYSLGRSMSEENRAKLRSRPMSAEARAKISAAKKGVKRSAETVAKIVAAQRLRPSASAETRAKLSAARKGWRHSEQTRAKMRRPRPAQSAAIKAYYARRKAGG
jgi:group I intron endonuclease